MRLMYVACAQRAMEIDDDRQRNLAAHIVNTLGKSMR